MYAKIRMMGITTKRAFMIAQQEVQELNEVVELEVEEQQKPVGKFDEIDVSDISSPALARLIEEVRNEEILNAHAYNRTHNRHNRSR
jgi:hypothetical protein